MGDEEDDKLTEDDWWGIGIVNRAGERMSAAFGTSKGIPDPGLKRYLACLLSELRKTLREGK